jgi:hypothetical protein
MMWRRMGGMQGVGGSGTQWKNDPLGKCRPSQLRTHICSSSAEYPQAWTRVRVLDTDCGIGDELLRAPGSAEHSRLRQLTRNGWHAHPKTSAESSKLEVERVWGAITLD